MKYPALILAALAIGTALPSSAAEPRALGVEASIPFADSIGVRNFHADGDDGVWIEDNHRDWYHAKIIGPCRDLAFANAIGVVTRGAHSLDKFGAIRVDGHTCQLTSLVTSAPPPDKHDKVDRGETK